jgi:hypothetical protein
VQCDIESHIDRSYADSLIEREAAAARRRLPGSPHHVLGNCRLTYHDADLVSSQWIRRAPQSAVLLI